MENISYDRTGNLLASFKKMRYFINCEKLDLTLEHINLKDSIHKIMIQVLPYLEEKDIDLDIQLEDCIVKADPYLVRQALLTYVTFAIQHSPMGGHIQLNCYQDMGRSHFEMEYNGQLFSGERPIDLTQAERLIVMHHGICRTKNTKYGVCTYFEL